MAVVLKSRRDKVKKTHFKIKAKLAEWQCIQFANHFIFFHFFSNQIVRLYVIRYPNQTWKSFLAFEVQLSYFLINDWNVFLWKIVSQIFFCDFAQKYF